jgi:hypothetical protein
MARKSEVVGLRLRMPAGLHRLLIASAKKNNRSLNSEVLWCLAAQLGGEKFVEEMALEQRRQMHNVLRALVRPENVEKAIAKYDKEMEDKS